jgi:hypothetical protein
MMNQIQRKVAAAVNVEEIVEFARQFCFFLHRNKLFLILGIKFFRWVFLLLNYLTQIHSLERK